MNDIQQFENSTPLKRRQMQRENRARRRRALLPCIPFYAALAVMTVVAWLVPLRPEVSEDEKRRLEQFPQFSFEALADGSYFKGVDAWFSDTFTFRDDWIMLADRVEALHGGGDVVIHGTITASDAIPEIPAIPQVTTGGQSGVTISGNDSQNVSEDKPGGEEQADKTAEKLPGNDETADGEGSVSPENPPGSDTSGTGDAVSVEDFFGGAGSDDAAVGTADEEETWGGEVLAEDEFFSQGAAIQIGDAVYAVPGFSQYYCERYVGSLNRAAERLDGKANIYNITVPSNISYMLSRSDREFMGLVLEEDGLAYMHSMMDERIHCISVFDVLVSHNSEYICFRTDHHWTALGAYYAYVEWCESAGVEPVQLEKYETVEFTGYLGTTYYKAQKSSIVADNPDSVVCYIPPGDVILYLSDNSSDGLGWEQDIITNRTTSSAGAKYLAFLAGDHAKGTFINNDITDGSACLVVKNSQGNPFVYYLTQHYQYVYVIDPRYYFGRDIVSFVDEFEVDDVIFCTSAGFAWGKGGTETIAEFVG